jgi:hypothetical protein
MRKTTAATMAAIFSVGSVGLGLMAAPAAHAADCSVHISDRRLWCTNDAPVVTRYDALNDAPVSGQLLTSYSWFDCWVTGQRHSGGNTTWYHTTPDWGDPGYVAAAYVHTPSSFDANPSAYGLRHC